MEQQEKRRLFQLRILKRKQILHSINTKMFWIWLGLGAISLHFIFSFFPTFTEKVYSQGIFVAVRYILDYTFGLLPFSATYILAAILLFFFGRFVYRLVRIIRSMIKGYRGNTQGRVKSMLLSVGAFLGGVVFFFYLLWGFNLARMPIEDYLELNNDSLTKNELLKEASYARRTAIDARSLVPDAGIKALEEDFLPDDLETTMRNQMIKTLHRFGYPAPGRVRCRDVWPKGLLRLLGTSGLYNPFTGEPHVEKSLSPILTPFTIAHEMAHAYGFTSESEANFLAFIACITSDDPRIKYSGRITHLIYIAHELWFVPMKYPKGILADIKKYGIFGRNVSYSKMILLVAGWRKSDYFTD